MMVEGGTAHGAGPCLTLAGGVARPKVLPRTADARHVPGLLNPSVTTYWANTSHLPLLLDIKSSDPPSRTFYWSQFIVWPTLQRAPISVISLNSIQSSKAAIAIHWLNYKWGNHLLLSVNCKTNSQTWNRCDGCSGNRSPLLHLSRVAASVL